MSQPRIAHSGKVVLFTSFYEHRAYSPYTESMVRTAMVLDRLGVKFDYWLAHGDFHIDRAVNGALTRFMNDPDATDILTIDSDESWAAEDIVRLLLHPQEVVAGAYRMKNQWGHYTCWPKTDEEGYPVGIELPDGTHLIEAERVSAGFLRIKKSVLRRFHEHYPALRCQEKEGIDTVFFERTRFPEDGERGEFHCHDMAFSRRLREMGVQLWIDPHIKINHWGITSYPGDLDAHLRGKTKESDAFAVVRQMAAEIEARKAA